MILIPPYLSTLGRTVAGAFLHTLQHSPSRICRQAKGAGKSRPALSDFNHYIRKTSYSYMPMNNNL